MPAIETEDHILASVSETRTGRRGEACISSKGRITIPAEALRKAGLVIGDRVVAYADRPGRLVIEREHDVIAEFAGALTGTYRTNELDGLRAE